MGKEYSPKNKIMKTILLLTILALSAVVLTQATQCEAKTKSLVNQAKMTVEDVVAAIKAGNIQDLITKGMQDYQAVVSALNDVEANCGTCIDDIKKFYPIMEQIVAHIKAKDVASLIGDAAQIAETASTIPADCGLNSFR